MTRVIVVGAGMGGLAAAFDLSARGADVTVVEQHATPGGKMRQVNIDGHLLDAGPTVFTMRWIFDDLFSDAGLNFADHVGLHRADLLARHAWLDGTRLDLYTDIETSMAAIETAFSTADAEAYRDFTDAAGRIFATLDQSFMRAQKPSPVGLAGRLGLTGIPALLATKPFATLWQDLCARFPDQRLAQLFARYSTYCGSSPFAAPATLQLIAHAERMGVWYLDGGMHSLAQAMAGLIEQHGGTLRYGAPVSELLSYDGRITGVVLEDGEALTADAVIFNGDNAALAEGLLGEGARSGVSPLPKDRDSLSAVTWNVVGNVSGFPLAHHTVLFGDDYPGEFAAVFDHRTVVKHPTVYICAQDRRDDEPGPAEERLLLLINAPAGVADAELDARVDEALGAMLVAHGVQLTAAPEMTVRTTPAAFDQMFPATAGALYGRPTHGAFGTFKRPGARAKIPGLYLAGGSVHPGAGVPMTTMSGRLAAACVRHDLGLG